jgi:transcription antitermination factor NusG
MSDPELIVGSGNTAVICDQNWYALYTRHHHERTVEQHLAARGFEVFLPLYKAAHRWKDRIKDVDLPLFPCYVFVRGGLERHTDIVSAPGVHMLVSFAGQPAPIPVEEIEALRTAARSDSQVEPYPFLKCGDRVRVKEGPLAGICGMLIRKKSGWRLVLSVELLECSAAVEVDTWAVERINRPALARRERQDARSGERHVCA